MLLLALTVIIAACVYLHFASAFRAFKKLQGSHAIDLLFSHSENPAADEFRSKVQQWLKQQPAGVIVRKGPTEYGRQNPCDRVLIVEGDFRCAEGSRFEQPVYVRGQAVVGAGSRFESLAVDGHLTLGAGTVVKGWVDGNHTIEVQDHCRIGSALTARTAIQLGADCEFGSAFAPWIGTGAASKQTGEAHREVHGNLIANDDIWLQPATRFDGLLHAQRNLRLGAFVKGENANERVAVFAFGEVQVGPGVCIKGKLASATRVITVAEAEPAGVYS